MTQPGTKTDYSAYPILYVDDEPANLVTFRFSLEDQFQILTAASGEQALELMQSENIAVLLADHRMDPGISGTELCVRAMAARPEAIRMVVTAHGDFDVALAAINRAQVRRFIAKPWQAEEMIAILGEAIDEFCRQAAARGGPADELVRQLADPATALRHNIEWSAEALRGLEPELRGGSRKALQTYRKLVAAAEDSKQAADELCEVIEALQPRDRVLGAGRREGG
jgi:response regulator RpfG family c-di-GMP phosphodiesterase